MSVVWLSCSMHCIRNAAEHEAVMAMDHSYACWLMRRCWRHAATKKQPTKAGRQQAAMARILMTPVLTDDSWSGGFFGGNVFDCSGGGSSGGESAKTTAWYQALLGNTCLQVSN